MRTRQQDITVALAELVSRRLEAKWERGPQPHDLLGVGIDLAERRTYAAFPDAWIGQAASRWLSPDERQWGATQPSLREAVTVVLCCKEAAWKAWNMGTNAWNVALTMSGDVATGGAATAARGGVRLEVDWLVSSGLILALARARRPR